MNHGKKLTIKIKSNHMILNPYTLIMMVGPSCCGKSRMATWISEQIRLMHNMTSVVISSDNLRRELLCDFTIHKMSPKMMPVSKEAFALLEVKVNLHLTFPVNTQFIFVDSTGLDSALRMRLNESAKANGYNTQMIVFNIPEDELMMNVAECGGIPAVSMKHQKTLEKNVLPNINEKYWDKIHIIKSRKDAENISKSFQINDPNPSLFFEENSQIAVIGDVHECVEELDLLIKKLPKEASIFFIGDLFDKGHNTKGMLDYITDLYMKREIYVLKGNHENYVIRRLKKEISSNFEIEKTFMTSVNYFLDNPEEKEKFLAFSEVMVSQFHIERETHKDIYLTHAPCKNKYLGKNTDSAKKAHVNFRFVERGVDRMHAELSFVEEESSNIHPIHIFGHVATSSMGPHLMKNKIWLDTGCVHGNRLSAVLFRPDGTMVNYSVKSTHPSNDTLFVV